MPVSEQTKKTTEAIDVSMRKSDPSNHTKPKRIMHGVCTNSCGGGTSDGLERNLRVLIRLSLMPSFLGVT